MYGSSCATDGSYMYCVGGYGVGPINSVYSAPISSSGIGTWTNQTNSYPTNAYLPSCAIAGGYIYCVGGLIAASTLTNAVYYAQLTSGTVGTWKSGTDYPTNVEALSCVISGGYITCVAGLTFPATISTITNAVYYAPVSSSGVGAWSSTINYPFTDNLDTCSVSGSYIFCMGGEYNMSRGFSTGDVYSDTLSSGAVGATWSNTTAYPVHVESGAATCATSGGYMYCVDGFGSTGAMVNYASISGGTLGAWTAAPEYPMFVSVNQVVISGDYIYGVGGQTSNAFYAQISGPVTSSSSSSSSTSSTSSTSTSSTSSASASTSSTSSASSTSSSSSSTSTTSSTSTSISTPPASTSSTSSSTASTTSSTSTTTVGIGVPEFSYGGVAFLVFLVAMLSLVLVVRKIRIGRSGNGPMPLS